MRQRRIRNDKVEQMMAETAVLDPSALDQDILSDPIKLLGWLASDDAQKISAEATNKPLAHTEQRKLSPTPSHRQADRPSEGWQRPTLENASDEAPWEIRYLRNQGAHCIDFRKRGGALWIYDTPGIASVVGDLEKCGMTFHWKAKGGTATNFQPAWWSKAGSPTYIPPTVKAKTSRASVSPQVKQVSEKSKSTRRHDPISQDASELKDDLCVTDSSRKACTIPRNDVLFVEGLGCACKIVTESGIYICKNTILQMAGEFYGNGYIRIGHRYIAREDAVEEIQEVSSNEHRVSIRGLSEPVVLHGKSSKWFENNLGITPTKHVQVEDKPVDADSDQDSMSLEHDEPLEDDTPLAAPELIGILLGISCDDEINEREAGMLLRWLRQVDDKGDRRLAELKKLLERVLEDDRITPEEEEEMLLLFNRIINLFSAQ